MSVTSPDATELIRLQEWEEAARILDGLVEVSPIQMLQRNLARNMACMRRFRPELYRQCAAAPDTNTCRIVQLPSGAMTLSKTLPDGRAICLSAGSDPLAWLESQKPALNATFQGTATAALCQLGDGLLLDWMSRHCETKPPAPQWQRAVYIIDPDIEAAFRAMTLIDLTSPDGPFRSPRFLWFLGSDWQERLSAALISDPYLVSPSIVLRNGIQAPVIAQAITRINEQIAAEENKLWLQAQHHYAGQTRESLKALLNGDKASRPPRALFLTSRFTTVLQYSIRDTADALSRMGWQTRVLIEPTEYRGVTTLAIRRALVDFKPDMVFSIDHLRDAPGRLFPEELPFFCWIQDDLPHLTSVEAARSIGRRDFVLTCAEDHYSQTVGYPRRQCIHLEKLTRLPLLPANWRSDGDDLVFVSNASALPAKLADQLVHEFAVNPVLADCVKLCGRRLMDRYASGGWLSTMQQMGDLFESVEREIGGVPLPAQVRHYAVLQLFNGLNNSLYRQQALGWFADESARRGLSLAIYGNGWKDNPRFAPYARGPIAYGGQLEEVTRRSRINLQIVPFSCLHQRLLDGWAAGGFFLVRAHDVEMLWFEWADILDRLVPPEIRSVSKARAALDEKHRIRFNALLDRIAKEVGAGKMAEDLVCSFRELREEQGATTLVKPPRLDEILFSSPPDVGRLLDRFIDNEPLRREIMTEQRRFIQQSFTYEAGMRRVLAQAARLIADEDPAWFARQGPDSSRGAA